MNPVWRRLAYVALFLFVCFMALGIYLALLARSWRAIRLSPSTTYLTGPLATDGFPDYLVALNAKNGAGATAENNAAPAMLAILGSHNAPHAWWTAESHLLAIPPSTATPWAHLHEWWIAHPASTEPTSQSSSAESPQPSDETAANAATLCRIWSPQDYPAIASYLQANDFALNALEKLTTRDRFYIPFVTGDGEAATTRRPAILRVHYPLGILRESGNAMVQRGLLRIGQGDIGNAVEDLLAAVRLAHLMNQQHTLLDYLVATAIDNAAMVAIQHAVASDKLPAADALRLEQQLATFPEWPAPVEALNHSERFTTLDSLAALVNAARRGTASSGSSPAIAVPGFPIHFELAFIDANRFTERECDAFRQPHYANREAQLRAVSMDLDAFPRAGITYKVTHAYGSLLSLLMSLSFSDVDKNMTKTLAAERLVRTVLVLHRYRAAHGHFPATLADLPKPALTDPFTDISLHLKATPTTYVLYSVGPDLADDGGTPPRNSLQQTGFDIAVCCPPALP